MHMDFCHCCVVLWIIGYIHIWTEYLQNVWGKLRVSPHGTASGQSNTATGLSSSTFLFTAACLSFHQCSTFIYSFIHPCAGQSGGDVAALVLYLDIWIQMSGRLYTPATLPQGNNPRTQWIGAQVDCRGLLNFLEEKRGNLLPYPQPV